MFILMGMEVYGKQHLEKVPFLVGKVTGMRGLLNITFTMTFIVVASLAALFMAEMSVISKTVLAQVPPLPSLPDRGDSITDNQLPGLRDQVEPIQSSVPHHYPCTYTYYSNYFARGW